VERVWRVGKNEKKGAPEKATARLARIVMRWREDKRAVRKPQMSSCLLEVILRLVFVEIAMNQSVIIRIRNTLLLSMTTSADNVDSSNEDNHHVPRQLTPSNMSPPASPMRP